MRIATLITAAALILAIPAQAKMPFVKKAQEAGFAEVKDCKACHAALPVKKDGEMTERGKFLKATFKGWNEAVKNPTEAAKIVVAADMSGSASEKVQKRQMENVAKLITNAGTAKIGYLEPAAYERTVKVLLAAGSSPVIKKDPGKAAYSHAVWEAAQK